MRAKIAATDAEPRASLSDDEVAAHFERRGGDRATWRLCAGCYGGRDESQMQMDYYLLIGAGMSKATIVAATKRFISIVPDAVKENDREDIVK